MSTGTKLIFGRLIGLLAWLWTGTLWAAATACFVCGKPFGDETIFTATDEITGEKVFMCESCARTPNCYLCGVPAGPNLVTLPDGRHLCPRDAKKVVMDTNEIARVCARTGDELDRAFVRFMSYPTNIRLTMIDRIDVNSMYVLDGYDVESPEIVGWCRPTTNDLHKEYLVGMMVGRPSAEIKSTCVHEFTHAWVDKNVPPARHAALWRSTEEGFCELMAYLMMQQQGESAQQKNILKNLYTRGQVQLFIEAEQRYGLNDVLDWMKYGNATQLTAGHLEDIHDVTPPLKPVTSPIRPVKTVTNLPSSSKLASTSVHPAPALPPVIKLNGIIYGQRPVAIINGCSLNANESGKILVGDRKIAIRCLAVEKNSARIVRLDTNEEIQLPLAN